MEEDTKPLLIPVGGDESNYGIMNIQFNPEDFKCKRWDEAYRMILWWFSV